MRVKFLALRIFATCVVAVGVLATSKTVHMHEILPNGPGPSGSNNPVVPANQTLAEVLQEAYANGLLTPQQVQDICNLNLGVYSYYWAIVGDPLQRVRT